MSEDDQFSVYAKEERGPVWRGVYSELERAKFRAQELATQEGVEFFVFSLNDSSEVARFFPKPAKT